VAYRYEHNKNIFGASRKGNAKPGLHDLPPSPVPRFAPRNDDRGLNWLFEK
jgi:hypothetical protein